MEKMEWKKSDISDLLPWEFRERLAAKPVAYLPLGMLAWHGEHLPLRGDAIQSEVLQGMDYADSTAATTTLDPSRQTLTDAAADTAAVTGDDRHSILNA